VSICGVKFRAYPTNEQVKVLSQWIGCARVIYNCKVAEDNQNYLSFKETNEKSSVNQAYSHFKTEEREWLHQCPSQILRNASSTWYTAKQRFFKKIAGNPTKKKKGIKDTVLLTSELFSFKDKINIDNSLEKQLFIGTKKNQIGILKFKAHREFGTPQQIVLGKKNNQWSVSFCYEVEGNKKTEQELLDEYSSLDQESLNSIVLGIDRGIAIPFQTSQQSSFDFDQKAKQKIKIKHQRLKRYQRRLSRQKKGSGCRNKTKFKISKIHTKISNIRHDFCHKTSHTLARSDAKIFAVEDLKLKNMTKAPKPKQNEKGKYLPNKRKAKAGLNRELLSKGLGKTIEFLEYKALKYSKLVVKVSPHYSSQECAACSHTQPENRKTQSEFCCMLCGNHDNADHNAAKVIAKRGVQFLLSRPKALMRTRLGISRSKAGRGISKTKLDLSDPLSPMTSEARLFGGE
jgi:putative transposase